MDIKIFVEGHADDLYALALLFPDGAYPGLRVVTNLRGTKDGIMDRVTDAADRRTFVTGEGCLPLLEAARRPMRANDSWASEDDARNDEPHWVAREILAPLNGYAVLADSNFVPVIPVQFSVVTEGYELHGSFALTSKSNEQPIRLISVARHPNIAARRNRRVDLMTNKPLAAYAANVIAGVPNWADYYRLLEDIAFDRDVKLDKLTEIGLADRQPFNAFKSAANNRAFGRHGASNRNNTLDQSSLMNLLEARQFIRSVVMNWLDAQCGDIMPTARVDGPGLRFGLDPELPPELVE